MRLRRVRRRERVASGKLTYVDVSCMMKEKERYRVLSKVDLPEAIKSSLSCIKRNRISTHARSIVVVHVRFPVNWFCCLLGSARIHILLAAFILVVPQTYALPSGPISICYLPHSFALWLVSYPFCWLLCFLFFLECMGDGDGERTHKVEKSRKRDA